MTSINLGDAVGHSVRSQDQGAAASRASDLRNAGVVLHDDGTIRGARRQHIQLTNAATTSRQLDVAESGAFIEIYPGSGTATTVTVTLPDDVAAAQGVYYDLAISGDAGHASADVIITAAGEFEGHITQGIPAVADDAVTAASTNVLEVQCETITFDASVSTTFGNTFLSFISNGSTWLISGTSTAVSGVTNPVLSS